MSSLNREVRLRPECAAQFPFITPDRWHPAQDIAAAILDEGGDRPESPAAGDRTMDPEQFEFRGGFSRGRRAALRTRNEDPEPVPAA